MIRLTATLSGWMIFFLMLLFGAARAAVGLLPAADEIAYVSSEGEKPAIYRMDIGRRQTVRLTDDGPGGAASYAPAWSPDGERIAYYALRDGRRDLHQIGADGGQPQQITNNGSNNDSPTWSPDGTAVAFISDWGGTYGLYVLPLGCTAGFEACARRVLPPDIHWYAAPAWSPDGSRIAFVSTREGLNANLFVVDADGRNLRMLTESFGEDYSPAWSPDSRQLVYAAQDVRKGGDLTIFKLVLAGGQPQEIIGGTVDLTPAWSPDGMQIIYSSMTDGNFELFIAPVGGGAPERLTFNQTDDIAPRWRPR